MSLHSPMWRRHSEWVYLLGAVLISLGLMKLSEGAKSFLSRVVVSTTFYPFNKATAFLTTLARTSEENQRLRRLLVDLSEENGALRQYRYENQLLRQFLRFSQQSGLDLVPARVVGWDLGEGESYLYLDCGEKSGIRVDSPVIAPEGLVGRVIQTAPNSAIVATLFSPGVRVGARVERSQVLGVVESRESLRLSLGRVPVREDVRVGDVVVTSGLGGLFPAGLRIGKIGQVSVNRYGFFLDLRVAPAVDLFRLVSVFAVRGVKPAGAPPRYLDPREEGLVRAYLDQGGVSPGSLNALGPAPFTGEGLFSIERLDSLVRAKKRDERRLIETEVVPQFKTEVRGGPLEH